MKKILGFLAISVFALSFGIACSKKSNEAKEPETTTTEPTTDGTGGATYGTETPPPEGGGE